MKRNRSAPESSVIPVVRYDDPGAGAAWLEAGLGFEVRLRIANHRVQMHAHGGHVIAAEGVPEGGSVMVRVEGIDAWFERAVGAGAVVEQSPRTYEYGERQCRIRDPWGHVWTLTETIEDVEPLSWLEP